MHAEGAFPEVVDAHEVVYRYIKSIGKGILKVMSKMGISTYQSYCGAQIFDAIGLPPIFVHRFFFGTVDARSKASALPRSPTRRCGGTPPPSATIRCSATPSMSAANMPTGCAARTISGRPRRSPCCSTPSAARASRPTGNMRRR